MANYTLDISNIEEDNLTLKLMETDDMLLSSEQFLMFKEDAEADVTLEEFRESDEFYSYVDGYTSAWNEAYLLQKQKMEHFELKLIEKYCSGISILYLDDIKSHVIALNSAGSDYSQSIELAYLILDYESPSTKESIEAIGITERGLSLLNSIKSLNPFDIRAKILKMKKEV
ncbi:hypothetical protein JHD46_05435 [Sulfurimonas sp. SAG-AH-194-C20]|nr:hypothetical protein [Sulfurimonas sp. SAG-AH-194-C20]MDF1879082.1 hypothetical protein [Sulfurimonas sp. SAG-AH-194-C20]